MRLLTPLLLALPLAGQPVSPAAAGSVEGVVVNGVTGVGIGGATVRLLLKTDHYETVTDGAGAFRISGLKPGDYVATVEKPSYTAPPGQAFWRSSLHIGSEREPVRLRFELLPPATLRGRVFGIDGKPAARARVELGHSNGIATAEDGSFVFENIEPGAYTLVARPAPKSPILMQDGVRTAILPTYFPSVPDPAAAQEIRLQPGVDQSGFDIRLQAAPVYRVRGVVLDPTGQPAAKAVVDLLSKPAGGPARGFVSVPFGPFAITGAVPTVAGALAEPAVAGPDGSFEFPSLPAGDWILRAESDAVRDPALQKNVMFYGAEEIRLGRGDVDDAKIELAPSFDLGVSFELSDGSPAPANSRFQVVFLPENGLYRDWVSIPLPGGAGGAKNLQPGRYRLQVRAGLGVPYYAARIVLGNADVTGQIVQLSAVSPPIRVIVKPAATIRGTVNQGGEGAAVILWPQSSAEGDLGVSAPCASTGTFTARGLAPGDYYAIAVDRYDPREMTTAAFLRAMASRAVSVRLEEGSAASLELNLTR